MEIAEDNQAAGRMASKTEQYIRFRLVTLENCVAKRYYI
jgi:hypothetical protein